MPNRELLYNLQTLKDNLRLFTPEILDSINQEVVRAGHRALKNSPEKGIGGRCDPFVVETAVHFPTEINLLLGIHTMENLMSVRSEMKQYETCPVCSGSIKTWRVKQGGSESYNLDLCGSCGYSFVNPRPSLSFLMEYYSSFGHGHDAGGNETPTLKSVLAQEHNDPNSTIDARRLIKTIRSLNRNEHSGKFLDVGCGYGFFSKEALGAGFEVIALELAKNEREIAKEMTGIFPAECSFEEFECTSGSMSVVFMSQILEHALDINLWIKKAHDLLVNDGILAIALPNYGSVFRLIMQENDPYICPPAHLNFFNPNSLSRLLENHGFRVEETQWVSRIPKRSIEKRLPKFGKPLLPVINAVSSVSVKTIDALHLGRMINVYGRKIISA